MASENGKSLTQVIRLRTYTYHRLNRLADRFREAVEAEPERYPAYAGRRITLSDVVEMLIQNQESRS